MSTHVLLEAFGYLASVLIAISLTMRSIVRLRWINLIGAACFTGYGILIAAYPVAALNFAIVLINVYFLWRMSRTREAFAVVEMPSDSPYLAEFLRFHAADITKFQPEFRFDPTAAQHVLMALRDLVPAGAVIVAPRGDRTARVSLDFVTAAYRDFRIGDYIFNGRRDLFRNLGYDTLVTSAGNEAHARYLRRVGFRTTDGTGYRLDLAQTSGLRSGRSTARTATPPPDSTYGR